MKTYRVKLAHSGLYLSHNGTLSESHTDATQFDSVHMAKYTAVLAATQAKEQVDVESSEGETVYQTRQYRRQA